MEGVAASVWAGSCLDVLTDWHGKSRKLYMNDFLLLCFGVKGLAFERVFISYNRSTWINKR